MRAHRAEKGETWCEGRQQVSLRCWLAWDTCAERRWVVVGYVAGPPYVTNHGESLYSSLSLVNPSIADKQGPSPHTSFHRSMSGE